MAKKNTQEEMQETISETPPSESALSSLTDAFNFLMKGIAETEVERQQFQKLPSLHVLIPMKKYSDKGAVQGFVIDKGDGSDVEVNITSLRLGRLDAPIMQRVMWPFDPNTGKRIQDDENKPACASSDGVSARKSDVFGYIGKEFVDWRDKEKVVILPDNCANCPLGLWKETYDVDGNPVMGKNAKGIPYHLRSAPPCAEQPTYVFWDFDRKIMLVYQAANFSSTMMILGSNGKFNKRAGGVVKGVEEFYYTAKGTKRPDVSPTDGVMHPLNFTIKMVDNGKFGMMPAPFVSLGPALTQQEIAEYATAIQQYQFDSVRGVISGEMWGVQESINNTSELPEGTVETPW